VKVPKYVREVLDRLTRCFEERDCLHCSDCVAFALMYLDATGVRLRRGDIFHSREGVVFVKFLVSTMSREYMPCERCPDENAVEKFAEGLLRLDDEAREEVMEMFPHHSEFKLTERECKGRVFESFFEALS